MKNNYCAIYARYSSIDVLTGEGLSRSIENQIKILTEYATDNGFLVYKVYSDYNTSGKNLNRPQIKKLLNDAINKCFSTILVKDLSRFGRDYLEVGEYIDHVFPELGLRFIAVNDHFDSNQYNDDLSIVIKNFMNAYYLKDISKKIRKTLANKGEKESLINKKFGYIIKDKIITIDEDAAIVVRLIYNLAKDNMSITKIKNYLNDNMYLSRSSFWLKRNNPKKFDELSYEKIYNWTNYSVREILEDIFYTGDVINFKSDKNKEQKSTNKRNILIENNHKPIICKKLYNEIDRNKFRKEHMAKRQNNLIHFIYNKKILSRGKGKANACFAYVINNTGEETYYCYQDKSWYPVCFLNKRIYDELIRYYTYISKNKEMYIKWILDEKLNTASSNNKLILENKKLQKEAKNLFEKYINQEINEPFYEKEMKKLSIKINNNENLIKKLTCDKINEDFITNKVTKFINLFYTSEDIISVIKLFLSFAIYDPCTGKLEIVLKIESELELESKKIENMFELQNPKRNEFDLSSMLLEHIRNYPGSKLSDMLNEMKKAWEGFTYTSIKKCIQKLAHDKMVKIEGNARICDGYYLYDYIDPYNYNGVTDLSRRQKDVYRLLKMNPKITLEEIMHMLNMSDSAVRRNLRILREKKALDDIDFDITYIPNGSKTSLFKNTSLSEEQKKIVIKMVKNNPLITRSEMAKKLYVSPKTISKILHQYGIHKMNYSKGPWIIE